MAAKLKDLTEKILAGFYEEAEKPANADVDVENHGAAAGHTQLG